MKLNSLRVSVAMDTALREPALGKRLIMLNQIKEALHKAKPKHNIYIKHKWLEDLNQVERSIHQAEGFVDTREFKKGDSL